MSREFDYIVVGAGSAGCPVAARLSESANVLLIEAGGNNRRLAVKVPAAFPKQFHSKIDWDYWTEPEPHLNGRRVFSPRAKVVVRSGSFEPWANFALVASTAPFEWFDDDEVTILPAYVERRRLISESVRPDLA